MNKKTLMILAALAAAYFVFSKKGATAAPAPAAAPAAGSALPGWAAPAASVANDLLKLGTSITSELKGMDGMIPSSLEGHMASLGAYGELGGTFYGSY